MPKLLANAGASLRQALATAPQQRAAHYPIHFCKRRRLHPLVCSLIILHCLVPGPGNSPRLFASVLSPASYCFMAGQLLKYNQKYMFAVKLCISAATEYLQLPRVSLLAGLPPIATQSGFRISFGWICSATLVARRGPPLGSQVGSRPGRTFAPLKPRAMLPLPGG